MRFCLWKANVMLTMSAFSYVQVAITSSVSRMPCSSIRYSVLFFFLPFIIPMWLVFGMGLLTGQNDLGQHAELMSANCISVSFSSCSLEIWLAYFHKNFSKIGRPELFYIAIEKNFFYGLPKYLLKGNWIATTFSNVFVFWTFIDWIR